MLHGRVLMQRRRHKLDSLNYRLRDRFVAWRLELLIELGWLAGKMEDEAGTLRHFGWVAPSGCKRQLSRLKTSSFTSIIAQLSVRIPRSSTTICVMSMILLSISGYIYSSLRSESKEVSINVQGDPRGLQLCSTPSIIRYPQLRNDRV